MTSRILLVLTVMTFFLQGAMAQCGSSCNCSVSTPGNSSGLAPKKGALLLELKATYRQYQSLANTELQQYATHELPVYSVGAQQGLRLGVTYGISRRLSVSAFMPYNVIQDITEGHVHNDGMAEGHNLGTVKGEGDASLLLNFLLLRNSKKQLQVIGGAGVEFPTGMTKAYSEYGIPIPMKFQPGSGSFDPIVWLAARKMKQRVQYKLNTYFKYGTTAKGHTMGSMSSGNVSVGYLLTHPVDSLHKGRLSLLVSGGVAGEFSGRMSNHANGGSGTHVHASGSMLDPNTGASLVFAQGGLSIGLGKRITVPVIFSVPVFHDYNGHQAGVKFNVEAGIIVEL